MSGYFKIHRQIFDSWVFQDDKALKLFLWLIGKSRIKKGFATITVGRGVRSIELKRGQMLFGRFKAEEALNYNGSLIYRKMQLMEQNKMISIESNNQYSIVTICNYEDYQGLDQDDEQPMNSERTANEQQTNSRRATVEQPSNTNKNVKKEDKVKNVKKVKELLFKESPFFLLEDFKKQFEGTKYSGFDLEHYHESVETWSSSGGNKKVDWIATARGFMLRDEKEGRAKKGYVPKLGGNPNPNADYGGNEWLSNKSQAEKEAESKNVKK